jgi:hypothetical protein
MKDSENQLYLKKENFNLINWIKRIYFIFIINLKDNHVFKIIVTKLNAYIYNNSQNTYIIHEVEQCYLKVDLD